MRRWLPFALSLVLGCGGSKEDKPAGGDPAKSAAVDPEKQCVQLAKLCGDKEKHVDKIVEECKFAAKNYTAKGCTDKATAAYDCYQRDLCGKTEKVWSLGDLGVLSERHNKCVAERSALRTCAGE